MADFLSRQNHKEDKDEEIAGMQVNISNIETSSNIPECMTIWELQHETDQDNSHLQRLKECIIKGWPENKDSKAEDLRPYWTF